MIPTPPLIPYLITQDQDFVLNSTGTWCVAMHQVDEVNSKMTSWGKMVFYNLSFQGKPIKTSVLLGCLEYAVYADALMGHHGRSDYPDYDPEMYADILDNPRTFVLPSIVPGSGQFPDSAARILDDGMEYSIADVTSGGPGPRPLMTISEVSPW